MAVRSIVLATLILASALPIRAENVPKEEEDLGFFMPLAPEQKPEKLQRLMLLAKDVREKATKEPEAVAKAISAAACALPPVPLERALKVIKDIPPAAQAHLPAAIELFASVRELGTAAECLEHPNTPHGSPGPFKYIIAANLFECEAIMPFWILEVLRLALLLRNDPLLQRAYFHNSTVAVPHAATVSISIYESGSQDATVTWLRIAEAIWTSAGIPNTVVINGLLTRQTLMDPFSGAFYKQHRIEYLASLRNAAMEPVYASPPGTYDYIIFINDVFFCAPDMLRLATFKADIACGLDFEVWIGNKKGRVSGVTQRFLRRRLMQLSAGSGSAQAIGTDPSAVTWQNAVEHMSQVHVEEAARQAAADARVQTAKIKPRYEFYDTWVSRDIGGNPYMKTDPIARDFRTIDLLHRGLPFPTKCCWNGMVVINATHLSNGLKFRASQTTEGEYDISECSLFCEDYRRLGATNVVVDPSVRVSYLVWTKEFHGKLPGGVGAKVPWQLVERSGALEQLKSLWSETRDCMKMTWVPLKKFAEEADLEKGRVVDLRSVDYTRLFLERTRQPPSPPAKPATCNLIMGPYGANSDGTAFDDLSLSGFGANPISRITHSNTSAALQSLQVDYGSAAGPAHGLHANTTAVPLGAGEFVNHAIVYYDEKQVYGMQLTTTTGRNITIGITDEEDTNHAWATPCPGEAAQAGKYRLISFAGTADKLVRSLSLVWTAAS